MTLVAASAVTAPVLAGCSPSSRPIEQPTASTAFQHIHALAEDPGPGDLLMATHEGIYRVAISSAGSASATGPIGGLDFDPMGFTLSGETAFASGHPGPTTPGTFGSPNMGLIRSSDLGKTWTNVSLTGETDFHALSVGPLASCTSSGGCEQRGVS